jgi:short-subunit dehydrogenase
VYQAFEEMDLEEIARLIQVNFAGACFVTRAFLPSMAEAGRGHVVMMASIAGRLAMTPCGIYSAAKHGMVAFAETLRAEVSRHGIGVHVICPGRVETDFFQHQTFVQRAPRPEAQRAIPVESVARATIDAVGHDRFLTYRPRVYGLIVWLAQTMPLLSRPLLQRLMRARVASLSLRAIPGQASDAR